MNTARFLPLPRHRADGRTLAFIGMNLLQHQDCDSGSAYDHSRNLTGKTANFFLLNNSYHTAHRLHPAMHWSKLPNYHNREIAPRMNPTLNHRSLIGLLAERLRGPSVSHVR